MHFSRGYFLCIHIFDDQRRSPVPSAGEAPRPATVPDNGVGLPRSRRLAPTRNGFKRAK